MKLCLAGRGILRYDGRRQKLDGNLLDVPGADEKIKPDGCDGIHRPGLLPARARRGNGRKLIWSERKPGAQLDCLLFLLGSGKKKKIPPLFVFRAASGAARAAMNNSDAVVPGRRPANAQVSLLASHLPSVVSSTSSSPAFHLPKIHNLHSCSVCFSPRPFLSCF